jgi:hypothetical protein
MDVRPIVTRRQCSARIRVFLRAPQQILQRQRAAALAISIALLSSLFANSGAEAVVIKAKEAPTILRRGKEELMRLGSKVR